MSQIGKEKLASLGLPPSFFFSFFFFLRGLLRRWGWWEWGLQLVVGPALSDTTQSRETCVKARPRVPTVILFNAAGEICTFSARRLYPGS